MTARRTVLLPALATLVMGAAGAAFAQSPVDTLVLRRHVATLAADSMFGRRPGTEGHDRAARYIVESLRTAGIEGAAAGGGYLQPIPLFRVDIAPGAMLHLESSLGRVDLQPAHFHLAGRTESAFRSFSAEPRRLGRAVDAMRQLDSDSGMTGRVAILEAGGGPLEPVLARLHALGAAGAVALVRDTALYDRLRSGRGPQRFVLRPEPAADPAGSLPVVIVGPEGTERLLPHLSAAGPGRAGRLTLAITASLTPVEAANIVARVPGTTASQRDSFVVYTAHYDHIGIATGQSADTIFNGLVDNATGVAVLLAVAERVRAEPFAHTTIFLFTTAEEEGSLGSRYQLHVDSSLRARTLLAINVDHPPPLGVPRRWYVEASGDRAARAAREGAAAIDASVELLPAQPTSDHWSFVSAGIDATFLVPGEGWLGFSQAQEEAAIARWWRPHRVDDQWTPEFPLRGVAAMAELALRIGAKVTIP